MTRRNEQEPDPVGAYKMSPVSPSERAPEEPRTFPVKRVAKGCCLTVLIILALLGLLLVWAIIDMFSNGIDITF
jgi:hypothetical protein